jgi:hypothetical protein
MPQQVIARLLDFPNREELRGGQPTGKGDDLRLLGDFQELSNGGALHTLRPLG